jgi:DNA-binding NarL/FixJ family response regulator
MSKIVLVADDSALIREMLCKMFEAEENYDLCAEAVNGEEAIALAKKHRPDLIILDFSMPVMNGVEAARELKRIMPHVPIIMFTLHADTVRDYLLSIKSPIDLFVPKTDAMNIVNHVRSLIPV